MAKDGARILDQQGTGWVLRGSQQRLGLDLVQAHDIGHFEIEMGDSLQGGCFMELQAVNAMRAVFAIEKCGRHGVPSHDKEGRHRQAPDEARASIENRFFTISTRENHESGIDLLHFLAGQSGGKVGSVHSEGMLLKNTSRPT
ncbi:hypothetical protein AVHY2522_24705 [Acidovorax sp. SUPP2522]|nr:hypothetical protein AVHY2522_24705 [Acidovorax sp. SUPP2522]